jgi:hypothetical protein
MQAFYTTGVMLGETEKRPYMSALLDGVYCSFNAKSFFLPLLAIRKQCKKAVFRRLYPQCLA